MNIHWTTIYQVVDESDEVKTYLLHIPEGFSWEEGSHTHLGLEGFNEGEQPNRSLVRHMSISTMPHENYIGITTRIPTPRSLYKETLHTLRKGDRVALFKTSTNVPLRREKRRIYLLSAGVGLATFRPLIVQYMRDGKHVEAIHSINVDSNRDALFQTEFEQRDTTSLTLERVESRQAYYRRVEQVATDQEALFYIVGSDSFLHETIDVLRTNGIEREQIMIDKHPQRQDVFFET